MDPADSGINGKLIWEMLEMYNDVVRRVGSEKRVPVIDLARLLPKNSLYFYDMSHFTNQGAQAVSGVLATAMVPIIRAELH